MRRVLVPLDLPSAVRMSAPQDACVHALSGETMGTTWSVKLVATPGYRLQPVRDRVQQVLDRVIAQMSTWTSDSDISRFNRAGPGTWLELPAEFFEVLQYSLAVSAATGGAFDPTVGALVDLWGFGPPGRFDGRPSEASILAARSGYRQLRLASGRRALQPGGLRIDLSGVAKGFAVDCVAGELDRLGIAGHVVEIGGELRGRGRKPDGTPWWVAIEGAPPVPETVVALHDLAIATSGDAARFFMHAGRRLSHTIDPRGGEPVSDRIANVTVLHRRCICADALATALVVLGADEGFRYAAQEGIAARFLVREAGGLEERATPAYAAMLD